MIYFFYSNCSTNITCTSSSCHAHLQNDHSPRCLDYIWRTASTTESNNRSFPIAKQNFGGGGTHQTISANTCTVHRLSRPQRYASQKRLQLRDCGGRKKCGSMGGKTQHTKSIETAKGHLHEVERVPREYIRVAFSFPTGTVRVLPHRKASR